MDSDQRTSAAVPPEPATAPAAADAGAAAPPPPDVPVRGGERLGSLDLLRGCAVLGIFMVNVWTFAFPFPAALDPRLVGFASTADRAVHALVVMLFYSKTMPIFAMLFGAGLVLFTTRVEARGGRSGRRWFARQRWLLVIGLAHAYLLWAGDILVPYAVAGLLLYRLRRLRPRVLATLAVAALLLPKLGMVGLGELTAYVRDTAVAAQAAEAAGEELTRQQEQFLEIWTDTGADWRPDAAQLAADAAVMRGGYGGIFARQARELLMMHFVLYPLLAGWGIAGLMLLGMALFKARVLSGGRGDRFYVVMAAVCYGVGLPATAAALRLWNTAFGDFVTMIRAGLPLADAAGTAVALGHVAAIVLAWRRGLLAGLQRRLAAAGRMAFTNYLAQTLVGVAVFYGYGLGQFARWNRVEQLLLVLAVWALQLAWSPWWLARFRYGPAEWAWRSLTYGRRQPLRRRGHDPGAGGATAPAGVRSP